MRPNRTDVDHDCCGGQKQRRPRRVGIGRNEDVPGLQILRVIDAHQDLGHTSRDPRRTRDALEDVAHSNGQRSHRVLPGPLRKWLGRHVDDVRRLQLEQLVVVTFTLGECRRERRRVCHIRLDLFVDQHVDLLRVCEVATSHHPAADFVEAHADLVERTNVVGLTTLPNRHEYRRGTHGGVKCGKRLVIVGERRLQLFGDALALRRSTSLTGARIG